MAVENVELISRPGPADKIAWDEMVLSSPSGTIFSTLRFLDSLSVNYELLVIRDESQVLGGCVLTRDVFGMNANALYCKHLGPVIAAEMKQMSASRQFANEVNLLTMIAKNVGRNWRGFSYRFGADIRYVAPFLWSGFRQEIQYTSVIRSSDSKSWRTQASKQLRYELRRAEKMQPVVSHQPDIDDWNTLHDVCMAPYRKKKAPDPISAEKLKRLIENLTPHGQCDVWTISDQVKITNVAVCVNDDKRRYFLINGSLPDADPHLNKYLISVLIDHTIEQGLDFDFEGSMVPSIARVYREFTPDFDAYSRVWRPNLLSFTRDTALKFAKRLLLSK